ncbi:MAG: acyl carrier protein [Bacteroidota bacterium]|jgi:acyl carrier protein
MKKQEFIDLFADRLVITDNDLNENTKLDSLVQWDSYGVLDVMVLVEDTFNVDVPVEEFEKMQTIGDLMTAIGTANFE